MPVCTSISSDQIPSCPNHPNCISELTFHVYKGYAIIVLAKRTSKQKLVNGIQPAQITMFSGFHGTRRKSKESGGPVAAFMQFHVDRFYVCVYFISVPMLMMGKFSVVSVILPFLLEHFSLVTSGYAWGCLGWVCKEFQLAKG